MKLVPRQVDRPELLDMGRGTHAQVRQSLHDIQRINTYLGGATVVLDGTMQLLQKHRLRQASILDIGTGSAYIPQRLVALAARRQINLQAVALDNSFRHLKIAREDIGNASALNLLQADAFRLPLPDNSVDIVISSLFLHHFRPEQIVLLLNEFTRVARVGWVMGDLVRHYVPLVFFRLAWPVFARSHLTRHDGTASLLRGYTVDEMQQIVTQCQARDIAVNTHFPYRMSVVWEQR